MTSGGMHKTGDFKAGVFTIPAHAVFVDALAQGILDQLGDAPERLADVRVLLPTRRACRSLREAFLRLSGGAAMLLPVMQPLGDVDEDELALEHIGLDDTLDLPPAIGGARRTALLARLVMAKDADTPPDQAVHLAMELARLVDQVHTEGLDLARLPELVDRADLSEHWQQTVDFLEILGAVWPDMLAEMGLFDPAKRRDLLLRAQAQAWRERPPQTPVIAAGSTGTIPATAELMGVIAGLPQGAVVLPGLDTDAPDDVWTHLDATHPQYGMAMLLRKLETDRTAVIAWSRNPEHHTGHTARSATIARALLPAEATHLWRDGEPLPDGGLDNIVRLDAPGPREEATAIALILRHVLETPERTAALITPDRALGRRVANELGRWGVAVDDSAGTPLDQTPPGAFFQLVADMAAGGFRPVALLACLKHPLAAGGMAPQDLRSAVRTLEYALLRGPAPGEGLSGLEDQLRVFLHDARRAKALKRQGLDQKAIRMVLHMLQDVVQPFAELLSADEVEAAAVLKIHGETAARLAEWGADEDERRLWAGDAGEALSAFIAECHDALQVFGPIRGDQYPALMQAMMLGRPVRPHYAQHPRLAIWGPLEARLQNADVVVLGGLNEGVWPPQTEASPWMSRPMMQRFGLPLPERRIGLSAHDFAQAFAAEQVYLTRSDRNGGSPQVPSRWLVRLDTLLGENADALAPSGETPWLDWATDLARSTDIPAPCPPPRPTPPVDARPDRLSVTQIETWVRDPYAIYARKILALSPLDDLEADASAADRGIVVHTALERFIAQHPKDLPDDAEGQLLQIGENVFDEFVASPAVRAFWWPRFKRIARWFVTFEAQRRAAGHAPLLIEADGGIDVHGFWLSCQADRLDRNADGGLTVIDYKTGQPPTTPQVECGLSPQLPLEAAIAKRGGFADLPAGSEVSALLYLRLSGGRVAGEAKPIKLDAEEAAENAYQGVGKLVHAFSDARTPYLSRPRPMFEGRFGDYDHLARVKEWSSGGEGGDA